MIQTNISGLLYCTRAVLPSMVAKNHGFIAGEYNYMTGNVYGATKAFVKHFTQNLKADLLGTMVRVSCIEPGHTRTEFQQVRFDWDEAKSEAPYKGFTPLTAEDIAEAIWWVVNQPEHVTVTTVESGQPTWPMVPFHFTGKRPIEPNRQSRLQPNTSRLSDNVNLKLPDYLYVSYN